MGYAKTLDVGDNLELGSSNTTNHNISTVAADFTVGEFYLPSTFNRTLKYAFADLWVGNYASSSALLNYLENATIIQATRSGSTTTALTLPAGTWIVYADKVGYPCPGKRFYGNVDIKNRLLAGNTTTFTLHDAVAHHDYLVLYDCQIVMRLVFD